MSGAGEFSLKIYEHPLPFMEIGGDWDALVAASKAKSMFISAGWLLAVYEAYCQHDNFLLPVVYQQDKPVAAGAFTEKNGVVRFLGFRVSDYLDMPMSTDLNEQQASHCRDLILMSLFNNVPHLKYLSLSNLTDMQNTPDYLQSPRPFSSLKYNDKVAPTMEKEAFAKAYRKRGLSYKENRLAKQGDLTCHTYHNSDEVLPRLDGLFEQHIRRWQHTDYPSMFLNQKHCTFMQNAVKNLSALDYIRYTELRLNDRLVAAHLGFMDDKKFIWYKPSYEPEIAKFSPGEVLIRRLIQLSINENADELDFALGNEAFKYRFATKERQVYDYYVTDSPVKAYYTYYKNHSKERLADVLQKVGCLPTALMVYRKMRG